MEFDRPIAIATTLFVILIVFFYLVLPKYQEVKGLQTDILFKEAELKGREKYFREIIDVYQQLIENKENLEKINTALPLDPSLPPLVSFLEEESMKSGLILNNAEVLRIIPPERGGEIEQVLFLVGVRGSYPAFRNFLNSLETSSRLISIEDIYFAVKREKDTRQQETDTDQEEGQKPSAVGGIHEFRLTIKVYSIY